MPQVIESEIESRGLQLHIEPERSVEASDLAKALRSIERQYELFALREGIVTRPSQAILRVSSFKPGSLDIFFNPEIVGSLTGFEPLAAGLMTIVKFGESLKKLLELFKSDKKPSADAGSSITVKDCDDAINIAAPIAKHGGIQIFNNITNHGTINLLAVSQKDAIEIMEGASATKAKLREPESKRRQKVALIFTQIDRNEAKTAGTRSPDQGMIQEIDQKPHSILFIDELAYVKQDIIFGENPLKKIFFVDVDIVEVEDNIVAYRVVALHGVQDIALSA